MFVIISPIQLLLCHKASHAPTPQQGETCVMCDAGKWLNDINCCSENLLVCTLAACCLSIYWRGQVWRVTGESNCLETWPEWLVAQSDNVISASAGQPHWHLALDTDQSIVTPLLPSWYILFSNIIIQSNVSGLLPTRHCYPWLPLVTPG